MVNNLICPECFQAGLTPERIFHRGRQSTMMAIHEFYDALGFHQHDKNTAWDMSQCSNGHWFGTQLTNTCWCGWKSR